MWSMQKLRVLFAIIIWVAMIPSGVGLGPWARAILSLITTSTQTLLRLPGFLMLELWFRHRIVAEWTREVVPEQFSSFLEVVKIMQFIRDRNLDEWAATILSYSVLFLCIVFLLVPMKCLVCLYLHFLAFALVGIEHYMSSIYVHLEKNAGGEVILDEFTKLERHGFHFLAQVMLGLTVSCLVGIQNEVARMALAVYTLPIVARMCGFPLDKLHVVHNFSCSLAMLIACFYLLNTSPLILKWIQNTYIRVRACFVVRGLFGGCMNLWRKGRFAVLLCSFWITLFGIQIYTKMLKHLHSDTKTEENIVFQVMKALGDSTGTPLGLLGLAVSVSYCSWAIVKLSKLWLGYTDMADEHIRVTLHGGYTEGITLIVLCMQTGLLQLKIEQRAFLLCIVLFIVISSLFQSLLDIVEPHLLALAATPVSQVTRHARALVLAFMLLIGPAAMTFGICRLLPLDLWLLIIVSNCLLTSLQTASAIIVYMLFSIEARGEHPWSRLDDCVYYCRAFTRSQEFLLALMVIGYGLYEVFFGTWSFISAAVLLVHCYFNVWLRLQAGWKSYQLRSQASARINNLERASAERIANHDDVCAICHNEMTEAVLLPCAHFFHTACMKKWLFVRQTCPMCHIDVSNKKIK